MPHDAETLNRAYIAHREAGENDDQAFAAALAEEADEIAASGAARVADPHIAEQARMMTDAANGRG